MLTCKKSTELISVKRYRKLSLRERMQLKIHLMTCSACRKFEVQSDFIDQALDQLGLQDLGNTSLSKQRKELIEKHIHSSQ